MKRRLRQHAFIMSRCRERNQPFVSQSDDVAACGPGVILSLSKYDHSRTSHFDKLNVTLGPLLQERAWMGRAGVLKTVFRHRVEIEVRIDRITAERKSERTHEGIVGSTRAECADHREPI